MIDKKDCKKIAACFAAVYQQYGSDAIWYALRNKIIMMLEDENPKFDCLKFEADCEQET